MRDALGHLALEQANLSASATNYVRHFCLDHGIRPFSDTRSGTGALTADWLEENGAEPARLLFFTRAIAI